MVGIVLVSHSRALATALVDLVRQMNTGDVPLAISAGVGDDRQEFGTDAIELMEAILAVFSPDGVLVLMDLGSAVLSAETALDLLPPEVSEKVRLCPAPFVEGSIAAAVQAGLGSDLETVFAIYQFAGAECSIGYKQKVDVLIFLFIESQFVCLLVDSLLQFGRCNRL